MAGDIMSWRSHAGNSRAAAAKGSPLLLRNPSSWSSLLRAWRHRLVQVFVLLLAAAAVGSLFSTVCLFFKSRSSSNAASGIFRLYTADKNTSRMGAHRDANAVLQTAQDVIRQGDCGQSSHGKRYRSLICTIVRNDLHLREFIVRHLLLGFCHIVIYDNNQVLQGRDYNITPVVEPFVQLGAVTHIPYMQNLTGLLSEAAKDAHVADCVRRFGDHTDWLALLDSDEYLHIARKSPAPPAPPAAAAAVPLTVVPTPRNPPQKAQEQETSSCWSHTYPLSPLHLQKQQPLLSKQWSGTPQSGTIPTSVGVLDSFLTDLEQRSDLNSTCALELPWRMMYGEHRVLKSNKLLMNAYPRFCFTSKLHKLLFRPGYTVIRPPHFANCTTEKLAPYKAILPYNSSFPTDLPYDMDSRPATVDDPLFVQQLPQYSVHLVHYFSRSIEEYIMKSEQSMPPWFRLMHQSYDVARSCELWTMPYDAQYMEVTRDSIRRLRVTLRYLPQQSIKAGRSRMLDRVQDRARSGPRTVGYKPECGQAFVGIENDAGQLLGLPAESMPLSRTDYALYVFLKLRIAQQHEWDESAYLARNPAAKQAIQQKQFVDGLHHYITVGFHRKSLSCWKDARGKKFCIG